jgi:hypothetical protein
MLTPVKTIRTKLADEVVVRGIFTSANLSNGTLAITHDKGLAAPYACVVVVVKNTGERIQPSITCYANSVAVNMTPWGNNIMEPWGFIVI